ncbi:hypothetical protein V6N13_034371 [Hibiscus sabdariffa]
MLFAAVIRGYSSAISPHCYSVLYRYNETAAASSLCHLYFSYQNYYFFMLDPVVAMSELHYKLRSNSLANSAFDGDAAQEEHMHYLEKG